MAKDITEIAKQAAARVRTLRSAIVTTEQDTIALRMQIATMGKRQELVEQDIKALYANLDELEQLLKDGGLL